MMKKINLLAITLLSLQLIGQDPVAPYLKLAAANNPELKAKFSDFQASIEAIPQARGLNDPMFTFGYFIEPIETRVGSQTATLGLTQSFPWFGTLKAKEKVACQVVEAKFTAFQDAKLSLFREVRISYSELYYLKKAIQLTEEHFQLLGSFKELARVNFESGKTGFVSVLRVEMEERELGTQLDYLKDSYHSASKAFELLINTPMDQEVVFPELMEVASLDANGNALVDSLLEKNLQLQELKYQELASDEQINLAQLLSKPSFSVGINYMFIDERNDVEVPNNGQNAFLFPQVGMSIPIFQKKYRSIENQAVLEKERIQYEIENKTNQLSTELEFHLRDYTDGTRRISLYNELYDLSERSLSLLQTEFTTGKTDFEEVLRMERKLLTYQLAMEKARVDINNAIYKINYLVGNERYQN